MLPKGVSVTPARPSYARLDTGKPLGDAACLGAALRAFPGSFPQDGVLHHGIRCNEVTLSPNCGATHGSLKELSVGFPSAVGGLAEPWVTGRESTELVI